MADTKVRVIGGKIDIQTDNTGANFLRRIVRTVRIQSANFKPVFDKFDPYFKGEIRRNFQLQGRPRRWAELAQSTQNQRVREGYPAARPILVRSGALMRGFRDTTKRRSYSIGNTQPYFGYHQLGQGNNPKREMVVVLRAHRDEFSKLAREHLGIE